MARIILKRDFDFFLSNISVIVNNNETFKMKLSDIRVVDLSEGMNCFNVSAMGYYSSEAHIFLKDGDMVIIRQCISMWYYMLFLSLFCLLLTLGLLSIIPPIVGSTALIVFIIPVILVTIFKKNTFFKISVVHQ